MPISGGDLRAFLRKVEEALTRLSCGPATGQAATAHRALTIFAELRCRQGAVFAWPLVLQQRQELEAPQLAEAVWAASAVPSPSKDARHGDPFGEFQLRGGPSRAQEPRLKSFKSVMDPSSLLTSVSTGLKSTVSKAGPPNTSQPSKTCLVRSCSTRLWVLRGT